VLQARATLFEGGLVDVSQQAIEPPKKAQDGITAVKRSGTRKKHNCLLTNRLPNSW